MYLKKKKKKYVYLIQYCYPNKKEDRVKITSQRSSYSLNSAIIGVECVHVSLNNDCKF